VGRGRRGERVRDGGDGLMTGRLLASVYFGCLECLVHRGERAMVYMLDWLGVMVRDRFGIGCKARNVITESKAMKGEIGC